MSWIISLKKPCEKCDPNTPKLFGTSVPKCKVCFDRGYTSADFTLEEFLDMINKLNNNGDQ